MPDPIWKRFGYGLLWPSWPACSQNWAVSLHAGSGFLHSQFRSSTEGRNHIVQNRPGSVLDGLVRFWPNVSGPEASRCARIIGPGSGGTQPARFQCPTFRLGCVPPRTAWIIIIGCVLPRTAWIIMIVQKTARIRFRSWLTVSGQVLAKRTRSGSKPVRKDHLARFWPTLPIGADTDRIWQVYCGK